MTEEGLSNKWYWFVRTMEKEDVELIDWRLKKAKQELLKDLILTYSLCQNEKIRKSDLLNLLQERLKKCEEEQE